MSLDPMRREIDRIDEKIVRLLIERAKVAVRIGEEKRKGTTPVQDGERESEVLERVRKLNTGPASDPALEGVYRRIIDMCLDVQKEAQERKR